MSEPGSSLTVGGGALVGEECHKPSFFQLTMGQSIAFSIIEDRCPMEASNVAKESLPKWVVSGSGNAKSVASQSKQNPGQPLPIPVMHGEEKRCIAHLLPGWVQCFEWGKVELIPATGKNESRLLDGMVEQGS